MPSGLQSFQIAADTDVRTKGIDDSMLSYNPNTLSDIPRNPVKPTRPITENPFAQLDPFSMDPFAPGEISFDPVSFDPVSFEEQLPPNPRKSRKAVRPQLATTVEGGFKERLLNPENWVDSLLTAEARALANREDATDQEKETSWRDALSAMRLLDQYDVPTQLEIMQQVKKDLKDVAGVDVDAYANINREGDPYMAASSVLIDANRAGYSTPQAISKALNAFNATRQAIRLPDPKQVEMALMLMNYSKEEQIRQQAARAEGLKEDTYVVGPVGDQSVMTLNNRDKAVLNQWAIPYQDAQESDIGKTPYAFLRNGSVVTENLDPYEYTRRQSEGIDMIEATEANMNDEMTWAGKDGAVERGTVKDFLVASADLGEDIRMVDPIERMDVILNATGQRGAITTREFNKDYENYQKDPEKYSLKYREVDAASNIPQISLSTSPEGGVDFSSGPADPEVVSPTAALTTGEVTDNNKVTKANEKQYENIDEYTKANSEAFTQRTDGIEKFANIGVQLLNGLEGTRKGGGGQRIIKKIAGIGSTIQDTIGFLTTETANKPYVEKFQGVFNAGSDILDDESGLIVGTWDQFKLTEDAPLWADLKQIGLTDLQELNTLAFNLAIASLRAKGIEDRGITNQKIALEMQSLGFGGDTMANEDAVAGLKTFLGLALDDYDRYNRDLFNKAPIMTITDSTYVPGKGNIYGGNVSKRRRVNPWVVNGFAREVIGEDGTVTFESLGQLTPFDTNPVKERLGTNITPLGTNIGPGGTVKVRVNDDPGVITSILMQQPDTFKKAPLLIPTPQNNPDITIPTGLASYGEMAVSFANKRTAIHKKHIANGKQPRTKEYNAAMSRDLEGLFVEYALNYFGEEALVPGTNTPARLAFEEWWNFVNTVPLSGETK